MVDFEFEFQYAEAKQTALQKAAGSIPAGRCVVLCGGSGCGCSASVLCGHILQRMTCGDWPRVLFAATGALMSPTTSQQGESIPGICHAVVMDVDRG